MTRPATIQWHGGFGSPTLAVHHESAPVNPLTEASRPPLPPFTRETAVHKVRLAEDAWNSRDPKRVSLAYTSDSRWRNRSEFPQGREEIVALLERKWVRELDYRLIKELWAHDGNRIAVTYRGGWEFQHVR